MNQEADKLVEHLTRLPVDAHQEDFPGFVVMFDEAHTLSNQIAKVDWTVFSELRRAIREIKPSATPEIKPSAFFFFLSTTGKIYQFTPPSHMDPSQRVQKGQLSIMSPFTATGLSHYSPNLRKDKETNADGKQHTDLEAVTSTRWQSLQSRALQVLPCPILLSA
jgi:hypothetical protein